MNAFLGNATSLRQAEFSQLFAYRHAAFAEKLKWDSSNARDGLEIDEFDRPDTIHVLARDVEGKLCGCARLLPATKPYLLGSVFPELMNGVAPHSSEVWEISRFTSIALDHDVTLRRQTDAWGCREVTAATVAAVMEVGVQRLFRPNQA